MPKYVFGTDIDHRLNWPLGRADRLAHRGRLPHIVLPDGSIRFSWRTIRPLLISKGVASGRK